MPDRGTGGVGENTDFTVSRQRDRKTAAGAAPLGRRSAAPLLRAEGKVQNDAPVRAAPGCRDGQIRAAIAQPIAPQLTINSPLKTRPRVRSE